MAIQFKATLLKLPDIKKEGIICNNHVVLLYFILFRFISRAKALNDQAIVTPLPSINETGKYCSAVNYFIVDLEYGI